MEKRVTVKGGHHCSWSMVSKDMKNGRVVPVEREAGS